MFKTTDLPPINLQYFSVYPIAWFPFSEMHQRQGDVTMAIVCNRWSAYNIFTNDRCARCFYSDFEIYRTNKWKRLCLGYCLKRYTARCRRAKQRRETHAALIQRYQIERAFTSYNDAMYLISSYIPRGWNNYQKKNRHLNRSQAFIVGRQYMRLDD